MELQRHFLSPRVTSITPGNIPLTNAFQPLKPLPEPTLEYNRDYLIPTKPYSPDILKQDLSLHNRWSYKSQGVKHTSNTAQDNTFVTHRSSGTTTSLNEKQSPDESHCIPKTFSDPSSTHLSWNSRMTSSPTWGAIGTPLSKTYARFTHNHPGLSGHITGLYMVITSWNPIVNIHVTGQLLHHRRGRILR